VTPHTKAPRECFDFPLGLHTGNFKTTSLIIKLIQKEVNEKEYSLKEV